MALEATKLQKNVFKNGNIQAKFKWQHVRDAKEEIPSSGAELN